MISPFGPSVAAFGDALLAGRTAIAPVDTFDVSGCRAQCAVAVAEFDASRWIAPMKIRRLDTTSQYALAASREALDAASVKYGEQHDDTIGVVLGSYTAGGAPTEDFLQGLFTNGPLGVPALIFNATVGNIAASVTALELKLRGPNVTISQKEASSLLAIGHAVDLLRMGQARTLVAGGVDALYPLFYRVHDRFRVLSHTNGDPEGSRPFDATRNGFVLGEGGFVVVVERADAAGARDAAILAEVLAVENGGATTGLNQWPGNPAPIARVMRHAIAAAGLTPKDIDVVYASANSTRVLDEVEARALANVFADSRPLVTSIKGSTGESSATGAAAFVAAIECGRRGLVPPIVGLQRADVVCGPLRLAMSAEGAGPVALINSVASGGALVSAVIRAASA